ncbi:hypothetical protein EAG_10858 [Camponotus floridanus]|uniref:Uncharacterized protein n=1 Tax=Camponotus floridanus TaxID=104421 RepID=E2A9K6_CAMFO|nr:hypothetical protein EAG_10858 [Camponotus floridanus]
MHFGCSCEFVRASNARMHEYELFMRCDVGGGQSSGVESETARATRPTAGRNGGMISFTLTLALTLPAELEAKLSFARAKDRQRASPPQVQPERNSSWRRLLDQGRGTTRVPEDTRCWEEAWNPLLGARTFFLSHDMARGMSSNEGEVKGKQVK